MKLITWNIRGLNNKGKLRPPKDENCKEIPAVLILQETKFSNERLSEILVKCWKGSTLVELDGEGKVGRLALV